MNTDIKSYSTITTCPEFLSDLSIVLGKICSIDLRHIWENDYKSNCYELEFLVNIKEFVRVRDKNLLDSWELEIILGNQCCLNKSSAEIINTINCNYFILSKLFNRHKGGKEDGYGQLVEYKNIPYENINISSLQ